MLQDICANEGWRMSACRWVHASLSLERRVRHLPVFVCAYVPFTDNEGPSTSCDKFYICSLFLCSTDFSRYSLETCVRNFIILKLSGFLYPLLSEPRQWQYEH